MPLAVEMDGYGGPDVLHVRERPAYEPGPGEVVVRVAVAAVNRADCFIRSGEWTQAGGWPYVPGLEAAGTALRLGPGVEGFAPGDRVITMMQRLGGIHGSRPGGYQQTVCVPAATLAHIPAGLGTQQAGALGLAAITAWEALRVLDVRPGQRVLVQGAASGVGGMAVQLLADAGAHVVGTTRDPQKDALIRVCGAGEVLHTRDPDWAAGAGSFDRVFDLVGRATFAASVHLLAPGGRLVFVGGTSGGDLTLSGWDLMRPLTVTGYSSENLDRAALQAAMNGIARVAARGALRVIEAYELPLAEAARAHAEMESGRRGGRILLKPWA